MTKVYGSKNAPSTLEMSVFALVCVGTGLSLHLNMSELLSLMRARISSSSYWTRTRLAPSVAQPLERDGICAQHRKKTSLSPPLGLIRGPYPLLRLGSASAAVNVHHHTSKSPNTSSVGEKPFAAPRDPEAFRRIRGTNSFLDLSFGSSLMGN
ncbi:hypothetical protein B0T10DRAFT_547541 [Thelonectria olida]|uniref:Uncharacterized protein n=1 Tax=Thelonectria olida TaxID=1576542 RepID=A0A9P8W5A7_9HYPO|nr:hypothetical protein B0T10DRAFT_547541 [Thelonectria olida]